MGVVVRHKGRGDKGRKGNGRGVTLSQGPNGERNVCSGRSSINISTLREGLALLRHSACGYHFMSSANAADGLSRCDVMISSKMCAVVACIVYRVSKYRSIEVSK